MFKEERLKMKNKTGKAKIAKTKTNSNNLNKGITLISLVITIIILLILAGVAISMAVDSNGLFSRANNAKEKTEIASEVDIVKLAKTLAIGKDEIGILTKAKLQEEIDLLIGEGKAEVEENEMGYDVYFTESQRYYEINQDGYVSDSQIVINDSNPGDITKGNTLDGTIERPYQINCVEDLIAFSNMAINGENFNEKYIKLNKGLNMYSNFSYTDYTNTEMFGDYNGDGITEGIKQELINQQANGFKPIEQFQGTFMGEGNEIKNIYIKDNLSTTDTVGFFRENTGTIKNLKISGKLKVNVETADNKIFAIGGIVGINEGTLNNVENETEIEAQLEAGVGWLYIGGIAGGTQEGGIIENSINKANFNITGVGDNRVGGVNGMLTNNSTIRNCHNEATLIKVQSTDYVFIGGVVAVAQNNSTIENCYNVAKLEAIGQKRVYLGGITSSSTSTNIIECYNEGTLLANGYMPRIGGIDADPDGSTISNCYNTGTIETTENSSVIRAGGIIGDTFRNNITIENCYNVGKFNLKGAITAKGGIFAVLRGSVNNCYYIEQEGFSVGSNISTTDSTVTNSSSKTSEDMKTSDFLNLINNEGDSFKQDSGLVNNGYPILNWQ